MTISSEKTGNLYLNSKTFQINHEKKGIIEFNVEGYTEGLGGDVTVKYDSVEKTIHVLPASKAIIFGVEFWGEYSDHSKRREAIVSLIYPGIDKNRR